MIRFPKPLLFVLLPALALALAGCNEDRDTSVVNPGASSATGTVRVLLGATPVDDLLSFSAEVERVRLVLDDGTPTDDLLEAPLRVEFIGLGHSLHWIIQSRARIGTYGALAIEFVPGSYHARAFDGSDVAVDAVSDDLIAPFIATDELLSGELQSVVGEIDLRRSLAGDGSLVFDPTGLARVAAAGEILPTQDISASVDFRDTGTLELEVTAFADDDLRLAVGSVAVVVDEATALVNDDGNPIFPQSLFYTVLSPPLTLVQLTGDLQSDGPFLASRLDVEDQNGVPGNFPVNLDGVVAGVLTGVMLLELIEVGEGEVFAGPILEGLGNPGAVEVSLSTNSLRVFAGNQLLLPNDVQVGQRVKVRFRSFPAPPFPALRVDLRSLDSGFAALSVGASPPNSLAVVMPPGSLAIASGLVATSQTIVDVSPLENASIALDLIDPVGLKPGDLTADLDLDIAGAPVGSPDEPSIIPTSILVRPGQLEGAEVTAVDAATGLLSTADGAILGSFGVGVAPGPQELRIETEAVIYGDATSATELGDLFGALAPGERLLVDVDGIASAVPEEAGLIRAFLIRVRVDVQ